MTTVAPSDLKAAFLFMHDLFRAPSAQQWEWLSARSTRSMFARLAQLADWPQREGALRLPTRAKAYEAQYIEAFDAGAPHPPVPLLESHYNRRGPVPQVLHENILFYQAFGLRLRSSANETADHLRHQLEFVAHLFHLEDETLRRGCQGEALAQIGRARAEYLQRHLLSWLPQAADRASEAPARWIGQTVRLALAMAQMAAGSASVGDPAGPSVAVSAKSSPAGGSEQGAAATSR
jgi:DMSO reductase family type II enzyme chaperone